jgi:hypothetical protein
MTDRQQIQRDVETLKRKLSTQPDDPPSLHFVVQAADRLAEHCLTLLDELDQVERDRRLIGRAYGLRCKLAHERADGLIAKLEQAEQKLGAATTMMAEAEKVVPGVITTAGRFSIGLNDRERAEAAEARLAKVPPLVEALERMAFEPTKSAAKYRGIAREALAAWEDE